MVRIVPFCHTWDFFWDKLQCFLISSSGLNGHVNQGSNIVYEFKWNRMEKRIHLVD